MTHSNNTDLTDSPLLSELIDIIDKAMVALSVSPCTLMGSHAVSEILQRAENTRDPAEDRDRIKIVVENMSS